MKQAKSSAATRERILDTAVALFNERGIGEVSTNHIAAAAGLSPGNLYYHFRNKEAIILAIYQERMNAEWDVIFALPTDRMPTLEDMENMVRENFRVLWTYRFFYREQLALTQRDSALSELALARRRQGIADTSLLLRGFEAAGVLKLPPNDEAISALTDLLWMVTEFWPHFVELDQRDLTPETVEQGIEALRQVIAPYLS